MKKFLMSVVMVLTLVGVSMAQVVPDTGIVDKVKNATAKLKVDGHIFAGKLYAVSLSETEEVQNIGLTTQKGSYLINGEIGVRYGIVRPFIGYETLTHSYDKKTVGLDLFFYDAGFASFGVRTSYSTTKRIGIDTLKFMQTGILVKF